MNGNIYLKIDFEIFLNKWRETSKTFFNGFYGYVSEAGIVKSMKSIRRKISAKRYFMIRFLISRFGVKNVIGNTKYMDWKKWNGLQSLFEWSCSVWEDSV